MVAPVGVAESAHLTEAHDRAGIYCDLPALIFLSRENRHSLQT